MLIFFSSVIAATKKWNFIDSVVMLFVCAVMPSTQELTIGEQFEVERFSKALDTTADPAQLKALTKPLLQAWHTQRAVTEWVKSQQL